MPGPLAVSLTGDITKFQAAMQRASDLAARHSKDIAGNFIEAAANCNTAFSGIQGLARLPGQMNAARTAALGLAGTATAVVGSYVLVSAAIGQANAQLDRFVALGENAQRAGVGVEFFQRFSEAAKDAKLEVAEIEAALRKAGSAVVPGFEQTDKIRDRLADLFESGFLGDRQSKGLADYRAATSAEQRIRAAVTAMQELEQAGERLAAIDLAERLFGADVAERIRSGRLEIEAIADSLDRQRDDLVKAEEVERAAEFRERLDEAYATLDEMLRVSVSLAAAGQGINDVWLRIAESTAKASTAARGYLDQLVAAANMSGRLQSPLDLGKDRPGGVAADLGEVAGTSARGRTVYDAPAGPAMPPGERDVPLPPRRPLDVVLNPEAYGIGVKPSGSGGGASQSLDQVQNFVNGLTRSTAALKAETEAFDKSNAEKATAINMAKANEIATAAGTTVTESQARAIREASNATADYKDRLQDLEQAQRQAAEAARAFGNMASDALGDAILEGRDFASILNDLSKQLARMALQAVFTGQGPLAGLLGSAPAASAGSSAVGGIVGSIGKLLGAGFAEGGFTGPGGKYDPAGVVHRGEFVVSAAQTARHRRLLEAINAGSVRMPGYAEGGFVGASSPAGLGVPAGAAPAPSVVTIAPNISIQAAAGTPAANADLAAKIGKQVEGSIRGLVADELRRAGRPGGLLSQMGR